MIQQMEQLNEKTRTTSALCPVCKIERPTFHDRSLAAYYVRHHQAGRSTWCKMSGQRVPA
jgi:DNA repair exonuclease SbcCD ATPase subunit